MRATVRAVRAMGLGWLRVCFDTCLEIGVRSAEGGPGIHVWLSALTHSSLHQLNHNLPFESQFLPDGSNHSRLGGGGSGPLLIKNKLMQLLLWHIGLIKACLQ